MSIQGEYSSSNLTADTRRGPSPSIWGNCPAKPWNQIDPMIGWGIWDDFEGFGPIPFATGALQTTEGGIAGRYKVFCSTAGQIINDSMPHSTAPTTTAQGGILSFFPDSDNDTGVLGTSSCPFSLSTTLAGKLWFEARVAVDSVATATTGLFVGLCENLISAAFSSTVPLAGADVTSTSVALLGFSRLENGLTALNSSYSDHAAAYTHVQASAGTIAAQTFIKLGFFFNPSDTTRCVRFYVNGVECSSALTKAILAATTHLDGKALGICMATYGAASVSTNYSYLDWWGCAQLAL